MVIATTDQPNTNLSVYKDCRERKIWVNVADNPPLCDFYMGGIVTKGQLKIAISTNGKSPTLAKRIREWLEAVLPEEIDELLDYLYKYRQRVQGDFKDKVKAMNDITKKMISDD
jgi:precorrin-2 dehydrogenase/sirohydrochlorin ferrochelatase